MTNNLIKIAIIEDDKGNQDYLVMVIKKIFCHPIRIVDLENAIDVLRAEVPEIILLDIKLNNGLSGCKIAKEVREDPLFKNTKIIVVSSFAMPQEIREITQETKCNGYLTKPFLMNSLIDKIYAQLEQISSDAESVCTLN